MVRQLSSPTLGPWPNSTHSPFLMPYHLDPVIRSYRTPPLYLLSPSALSTLHQKLFDSFRPSALGSFKVFSVFFPFFVRWFLLDATFSAFFRLLFHFWDSLSLSVSPWLHRFIYSPAFILLCFQFIPFYLLTYNVPQSLFLALCIRPCSHPCHAQLILSNYPPPTSSHRLHWLYFQFTLATGFFSIIYLSWRYSLPWVL